MGCLRPLNGGAVTVYRRRDARSRSAWDSRGFRVIHGGGSNQRAPRARSRRWCGYSAQEWALLAAIVALPLLAGWIEGGPR